MSERVKDPLIFETSYRKDTAAHLDEEIEKRYHLQLCLVKQVGISGENSHILGKIHARFLVH